MLDFTQEQKQELQNAWDSGATLMTEKALKIYPQNDTLKELHNLFNTYGWEDNWTEKAETRKDQIMSKYFSWLV